MSITYHPVNSGEVVDSATLTAEIEKARRHLAAAIEAKGEDYVYLEEATIPDAGESCFYLQYESVEWDEEQAGYVYGKPKCASCIVGHVLVGVGIPFDQIIGYEGTSAEEASTLAFTSMIVRRALDAAQAHQDNANGYTWGSAVEEFEAYIARHTTKVETDD